MPHLGHRLTGHIGKFSDVLGTLAALCMAGLFLLMIAEIVARGVFSTSLGFSWEVSGYLLGAVIFLGAANALRSGSHVRISFLLDMLPRHFSRALDVASTLVAALITAYMTYAFFKLGWTSWSREIVSATVVQTPLFIPQLIFAIGLATLFLQLVARLLSLATGTVAEAETIANRIHQE